MVPSYPCGVAVGIGMCLLLGATGVGKSLLVKRLQTILRCRARGTAASGGGVLSHGWGTPGVNGARGCWILMGAVMSPWGLEWGLWSGGVSGEAQGGIRPLPTLLCPIWVLDFPAQLSSQDGKGDLGDPPPTRPTVGVRPPAGLVEKAPPAVCKVLWVILSGNWNRAGL